MSTPVRWYRVPVLWLGIALFGASLAGCIGMIVLASQYSDEPAAASGERLLKMPTSRDSP